MRVECSSGGHKILCAGSVISYNGESLCIDLKDITQNGDNISMFFHFVKDEKDASARLICEGGDKRVDYTLYNFTETLGRGWFTPRMFAESNQTQLFISFIAYQLGVGPAYKLTYSIFECRKEGNK